MVKVLVPGRHCSKPKKGLQNAHKSHGPLSNGLEDAKDNTPTSMCSQETSPYQSLSCQNVTAKQLSRSRAPLSGVSGRLCHLTPGGRKVRQLRILTPSLSLDDEQAHTPTQQFQFPVCIRSLQRQLPLFAKCSRASYHAGCTLPTPTPWSQHPASSAASPLLGSPPALSLHPPDHSRAVSCSTQGRSGADTHVGSHPTGLSSRGLGLEHSSGPGESHTPKFLFLKRPGSAGNPGRVSGLWSPPRQRDPSPSKQNSARLQQSPSPGWKELLQNT